MENRLGRMSGLGTVSMAGAVLLGFAFIASPATAQSIAEVDIQRCLLITNDAARIRCYDDVARALAPPAVVGAPLPPSPVAANPQQPRPSTTSSVTAGPAYSAPDRVATYGLPPARVEGEDDLAVLHDRIMDVDESGFGAYIVTLASGQVWRQTSSQRYHMKKGQEVTIRPTAWGADHRLHAAGSPGHIQVKRIK